MSNKNWSRATRFLHIGMVLTITTQLFISLVMVAPDHAGSAAGKLAFDLHQIVGLSALGIIAAHWVWSIINHADGGLRHLFPWFGQARVELINDGKGLLNGELPAGGKRGGLPGMVHGLGLLAVTAVAITGGVLYFIFPQSGEPGYVAELFAQTHEGFAALVWAYWVGHGGLAILHHMHGSELLKNMFSFSDADNKPAQAKVKTPTYVHLNSSGFARSGHSK